MIDKQKAVAALEAHQNKYKGLSASVVEGCIGVIRGLPEEVQALAVAKKAGRLAILPCKVGQTIYEVVRLRDGGYSHINHMTAVGIHIGDFPDLRGHKRKSYLVVTYSTSDILGRVSIDRIGTSVFLSREEAEAALKGDIAKENGT